ncbi:MAG: LURP-one-related family protein [Oscillospiraceae bacterium]|nr:LURP-one-related family protein [Oscillospiraceae bacterium]
MKLYIRQKVFSWRDRFTVKDEAGQDRYSVAGEIFTWGRKLHVYDAAGNEAAFIRAKVLTFLEQKYYIELGGQCYTLIKEFTFFKPKFRLEGVPWRMEGNFWEHEYNLVDGGETVMSISQKWLTWGDSYELDIAEPKNELLCLCVALAVDGMKQDGADAAAASSSAH